MKWLEELLSDVEGKESLIKDIKSNLAKDFVPKNEFNTKNDEVKELKDQVSERDAQLKELKDSVKGNDELTEKIEKLEKENKKVKQEYDLKLKGLKKKHIASKKLLANNARDVDVILPLFNLDEFELNEDGTELVGFEDKINEHKESYSYLYKEPTKRKLQGFDPEDSSGDDKNVDLGVRFAKSKNDNKIPESGIWK